MALGLDGCHGVASRGIDMALLYGGGSNCTTRGRDAALKRSSIQYQQMRYPHVRTDRSLKDTNWLGLVSMGSPGICTIDNLKKVRKISALAFYAS
jgi:hypothetical protein